MPYLIVTEQLHVPSPFVLFMPLAPGSRWATRCRRQRTLERREEQKQKSVFLCRSSNHVLRPVACQPDPPTSSAPHCLRQTAIRHAAAAMGCPASLRPLQRSSKHQSAMGDPLDSALSRSLGRGLSEELRELAEFGLGGESTQMPQPMNVEEVRVRWPFPCKQWHYTRAFAD